MRRTPALTTVALAAALAAALALCACAGKASPAKPDSPPAQGQGKLCGGIAGIRCDDGEYCRMDGPAHPDQAGVCRVRPQMCPMIWQPVCGSNGKTYPNACHAAREGVSVKPNACPK